MRRNWIIGGIVVTAAVAATAGAFAAYQRGAHWKEFKYTGTRLMANLEQPDALIRTQSLTRLPRDLLKAPIAKDVLTADIVFYYEQNEDRLGLKGAIKRIAYEHKLEWSDRILAAVFDEPAEVAFWRDGKGALRHYAMVIQRNTLAKVLQEAATVALKDQQLEVAGEIEAGGDNTKVYALTLHPRRTLLLVSKGSRIVVLSDPGMLFDKNNKVVPEARAAVAEWLEKDGVLTKRFALEKDATDAKLPVHTIAIGAPTLSLGYGSFLPGFKGLRFDFGSAWSTSAWVDPKMLPRTGLGDAAVWNAAPANPGACVTLPVDWRAAKTVVTEADRKPELPSAAALASLEGTALACWYGESQLYSPVFIARLAKGQGDRNAALKALAAWAIARPEADKAADAKKNGKEGKDSARIVWRAAGDASKPTPALAARGDYVVFSPDGALVDLVLDTLAHKNPSVADQMPVSDATLGVLTPSRLSAMAEKEMLAALSGSGDAGYRAVVEKHLPARMKALAAYPPYRLEFAGKDSKESMRDGWQRVEWRTPKEGK
jgi:uncharacterized protein YfaA (DUF2138 family)